MSSSVHGRQETSLQRRRVLAALAACLPFPGVAAPRQPSGPDVIDVKALGAFGDGRLPDLRQIREAFRLALERPAGATIFFPPGEYFLGAADEGVLLDVRGARELRIVGDRATLTCRSVNGQSTMLQLSACRNVTLEQLAFRDHGLKRDVNWLGAAAIRLANADALGCRDIRIRNCRFDSVLAAVVCRRSDDGVRVRTRDIELTDLTVRGSYYGFNFQDNGDNVIARRLFCDDMKRSYFAYGVDNHDLELETVNNTTGFTDLLLKCYHGDTTRVKAKVRCRGKRGGDAIVALDNQHEKGRGTIRQIDLQLDVADADCRLDSVVLIRSFSPAAKHEKQTQNRWDEISIDGDVHVCERTRLLEIASVGVMPGTLRIGPKLARSARLPRSFPGFRVSGV